MANGFLGLSSLALLVALRSWDLRLRLGRRLVDFPHLEHFFLKLRPPAGI